MCVYHMSRVSEGLKLREHHIKDHVGLGDQETDGTGGLRKASRLAGARKLEGIRGSYKLGWWRIMNFQGGRKCGR